MKSNEFTEVPITNGIPHTNENIGFSFKQSIRNKATDDQLRKLGYGWSDIKYKNLLLLLHQSNNSIGCRTW